MPANRPVLPLKGWLLISLISGTVLNFWRAVSSYYWLSRSKSNSCISLSRLRNRTFSSRPH